MTFKELKEKSEPHFYCLTLDRRFPKPLRDFLRKGSALASLVSLALSFGPLPLNLGFTDGLFFLFIFTYLALSFLEFFYRSMMDEGLQVKAAESIIEKDKNLDFALSGLLFAIDQIDVTAVFFKAKIGREIILKSGVALQDLKSFIYSERNFTIASSLNFGEDFINLVQFAGVVYDADNSLSGFLAGKSVTREKFLEAADFVMNIENRKIRDARFWSRENLGDIPSIATVWSYETDI